MNKPLIHTDHTSKVTAHIPTKRNNFKRDEIERAAAADRSKERETK